MDLTPMHYAELVKAALSARPGWVPLGPLDAARRGWKQFTYPRANYLADLEQVGLITCAPSRSGKTAAIRLTLAGRQTITDMPDNLHTGIFPLPLDILAAKAKVRQGPAMEFDAGSYSELVLLAFSRKANWIPASVVAEARLHHPDKVVFQLEKAGLVSFTPSVSGYDVRLTEAGKQVIRDMPDDIRAERFPLREDIARAKARVG